MLVVALASQAMMLHAAGVTARLSGNVVDQQAAVIAGATISAVNEATGLARMATSSSSGYYQLLELPIGSYRLEVEAPGFRKYIQEGIVLSANQSARNDVLMTIGAVSEQVTVKGEASIIDTSVSGLRYTIDPKRMTEIPLVGRNILSLAALLPGAIMTGDNVFDTSAQSVASGVNNSSRIFINGSRSMYNVFQLDGVDFTGANYEASPGRYPPPDSIEEVSVLTTGFKAEFGAGTSMFNAVTKSGTNQFHGSASDFIRNNAFNARSFFDPSTISQYQYNQFGATIGGPVIKNKTFFFFSYAGLRGRLGNSPNTSVVPSAAQRSGDFSGTGITLTDPITGKPFLGNKIPQSRLDPTAQKVLSAFVPLSNAGNNEYIYTFPTVDEFNQYLFNVDHSFTANSRLSVRGLTTYGNYITPPALPGFTQSNPLHPSNLVITHTQTLGPSMVNEARAYVERYYSPSLQTQLTNVTASDLGFQNHPVPYSSQVPGISVDNYFSVGNGGSGTTWSLGNKYGFEDGLTMVRGRHTIKVGGSYRTSRYAEWGEWGTLGGYDFNGNVTGDALGDYLIGSPASYLQRSEYNLSINRYSVIGYAQDDYKVTSRFTLNAGFRWDFNANPKERTGQIAFWVPQNFYTNTYSTLYPNMPPGQLYSGDPGMPDRVGSNHYADWGTIGPRVGFSYDLFGNGKTVVRSSFGIFSVPVDLQQVNNASERPPFILLTTLNYPPSFANPFQGRTDPFLTFKQGTQYDVSSLYPINPSPDAIDYRNGYSEQWNVTVEHQLGNDFKGSISYVGSHALALWRCPGVNPATYIPGVDADGQPLSTVQNVNSRYPMAPYYQDVYFCKTDATRKYDSMQIVAEKRFSHGWTVSGNYSLANSMSWNDDGARQRIQNELDAYAEYARTNSSVRHSATISWVYELPKFAEHNLAGSFTNGWEFSGVTSVRSGFPYNLYTGTDNSMTGVGNDRPDQVLPTAGISGGRSTSATVAEYFNTAAFVPNAIGKFGSVGYNSMTGPGSFNTDAALVKRFPITETIAVQFRTEAFNLFNHANFGNPDPTLNSPTYGQIRTASPGRILQFALKFTF